MPEVINLATLEKQNEILSHFPIEGGVDWSEKTFQTSTPTGTHEANTHLDITGSGYLAGIWCGTDSSGYISIQIDNGNIYKISTGVDGGAGMSPFLRFNNRLVVKGENTPSFSTNTWVVLD